MKILKYKVVRYKSLRHEIQKRTNTEENSSLIVDVLLRYISRIDDEICPVYFDDDTVFQDEEFTKIANAFKEIYNEYDFDYIDFT